VKKNGSPKRMAQAAIWISFPMPLKGGAGNVCIVSVVPIYAKILFIIYQRSIGHGRSVVSLSNARQHRSWKRLCVEHASSL
jgi:hypothetical protein